MRADSERPMISSIRLERTNVTVTVAVPPGIRRVTLECRARAGRGTWEPRAVSRTTGARTVLTFKLERSRQVELIRVRADATEPLPSRFYSGTTSFVNQASSGDPRNTVFAVDDRNGVPPPNNATPTESGSRAVVESDIWKVHGETLYFFNQYRGLQVIDISSPDAAVVRGTLELPAAGEQMYVLDDKHIVLLATDGCRWSATGPESQVLIVDVANSDPKVVAAFPVAGYIQESRLVGTALYVASQAYRPLPSADSYPTWEWGTRVSSFDLADPAVTVARNTLWYSGYGNAVAANDVFLFVVTQSPDNWMVSQVRCIDITNPNGTMAEYASIQTAGRIADKFKLDWSGAVLTAVSQIAANNNLLATKLETFRLPHPLSAGPVGVMKLGELGLAMGEQLFATRFDGQRVYIVTFGQQIRIDPFWIVDLSDPTRPRITGELEVPGFSTFLYPWGDRVVAVGIETNQVSVSLFDVADSSRPRLLSRALLGQGFSWSEATADEKAFNVLPDAGLILLPFSSSSSNGWVQAVQLVDLNRDSLRARGVIEHSFWPRRATLYGDRILSISSWQLLSVDATDRDHPAVRGETKLAWAADRVFVAGSHLLQLSTASGWEGDPAPTLRVTPMGDANHVLSEVVLTNLPVLGASVREGRLYVLQGQPSWYWPVPIQTDGTNVAELPSSPLTLTIFGLKSLPALPITGEVTTEIQSYGLPNNLQAIWPNPDVLVWAGSGGGYPWWGWGGGPVLRAAVDFIGPWWPYSYGSGGQLVAFDVGNPSAPAFASLVNLTSNSWWNVSKAFAAGGLVYLSHTESEYWLEPYPLDWIADPFVSSVQTFWALAPAFVSRCCRLQRSQSPTRAQARKYSWSTQRDFT